MPRTIAILAGLLALADAAGACPWARRCCCPPVYYVPSPPPVAYYSPPGPPAPAAEPAPPAEPPALEPAVDPAELYKRVVDSVAFIVVPLKNGIATGSGSLIDKTKRYVLTNYHIVGDAEKVFVQFPIHKADGAIVTDKKAYIERIPAGQAIRGSVLYRDKTRDLAIVQLDKLPPTAKEIRLAKKSAKVGETTWSVYCPGKVNAVFSTSRCTVRGIGEENFEIQGDDEVLRIRCKMVTHTRPVAASDSGGPLVNRFGELVAVAESGIGKAQVLNLNPAIDVSEVRAFLAEKKIVLTSEDAPTLGRDRQPSLSHPGMGLPRRGPDGQYYMPGEPGYPRAETDPDGERAAAQLLRRAKLFDEGEDNRPFYIAKLKDVVKKYPDTAAGKEAKKRLAALAK